MSPKCSQTCVDVKQQERHPLDTGSEDALSRAGVDFSRSMLTPAAEYSGKESEPAGYGLEFWALAPWLGDPGQNT